jgi:hypothetical protein
MTYVFATMLTRPRINACFTTPSGGLFLTCTGEKYIQCYTILYNVQQLICWDFKYKKFILGVVGLPLQGYKLPSTPVPCCESTALFTNKPLASPHPLIPPLRHIPTHVILFHTGRRRHWYIEDHLDPIH